MTIEEAHELLDQNYQRVVSEPTVHTWALYWALYFTWHEVTKEMLGKYRQTMARHDPRQDAEEETI